MKSTATLSSVTIYVGPAKPATGTQFPVLTLRSTSPLWTEEEWGPNDNRVILGNGSLHETRDFLELVRLETGLKVAGYDDYYCLSFDVELTSVKALERAVKKLEKFVNKHFERFEPEKHRKA